MTNSELSHNAHVCVITTLFNSFKEGTNEC